MTISAPTNSFSASPAFRENGPQAPDRETQVFLAGVSRDISDAGMEAAVRDAALAASDFSWLSKGDSVFIKPVFNSGNRYPSTTSPVAIVAMVKLLKEKGARRVVVGDMSGIEHLKLSPDGLQGSSRRLMENTGAAGPVAAAGAELHFFEEAGWHGFYEDSLSACAHWKQGLMMPNILKEMDHIILMPRCGRHILAGASLGMKAAVGYWRTDTRLEYHRDAATFHEKTAEANTAQTLLKKQRLVISAADKLLTTIGPDHGYVHHPETGLIIASQSIVAHDRVSLAWLLENRSHIPQEKRDSFADRSPLVARLANYWVVGKLGGWGRAFASEKLIKNDLGTIRDDRVLNHAYRIFHGAPELSIAAANRQLPETIRERLNEMTTI